MSAIGDYVHLTKENYLIYGTAKKGQSEQKLEPSLNAQRQLRENRVKNLKLSKDMEAILEDLKDYLKDPSLRNDIKSKVTNKGTKTKSKYLTDKFINHLTQEVNQNSLKRLRLLTPNEKNIKIYKDDIEDLKKARRRILQRIKRAEKEGMGLSKVTCANMQNDFNIFFQKIGLIKKRIPDLNLFNLSKEEQKNTLAALKETIDGLSAVEFDQNGINGVFGEALVQAAVTKAAEIGKREVYKTVKATIEGDKGSSFNFSEKEIDREVAEAYQNLIATTEKLNDKGLNLYRTHYSQDKIDVSVQLGENEKEELGISVKAYTPKGNKFTTHLQDIDLVSNLANTAEQFGNHWLNLHSLAIKENEVNNEVENELKTNLAYEAFASGNMLKNAKTANAFIVLDPGGEGLYIKSINDILNKDLSNFKLYPDISTMRFINEPAATPAERIARIVQQARQQKIKAVFTVTLVKNNLT